MDPRGIGPRPHPCHGCVIPLYYGPVVSSVANLRSVIQILGFKARERDFARRIKYTVSAITGARNAEAEYFNPTELL